MDSDEDSKQRKRWNSESKDEDASEEEFDNLESASGPERMPEQTPGSETKNGQIKETRSRATISATDNQSQLQHHGKSKKSKTESVKYEGEIQESKRKPETKFEERDEILIKDESMKLRIPPEVEAASIPLENEGNKIMDEAIYGLFPPFFDGHSLLEVDSKNGSIEMEVAKPKSERGQLAYEGEDAFMAGNASIYYLEGILDYERMNLDDAISNLTKCFEITVEIDLFDYMVKSQVQLASVHIKRYQLHDNEEDYDLALVYSENLIQIGKEHELHELVIESLILRAILRKMAKDLYGAREDLVEVKSIAKQKGQKQFEFMIETELREVKQLIASSTRKKRLGKEDEERMTQDALEKMPALVNGVLGLDLRRKARIIPVQLYRIVVMDLPAGLPLYSHNFRELPNDEEFLVFGLLSALTQLAAEVTPNVGQMKTLSHEGQTVMMEHRGQYMAALFASKDSFIARQSLGRFLKEFLRSFPDMTESGRVITGEQREAANQLLQSTFRFFLSP